MPCSCRDRQPPSPDQALTAATTSHHEVYVDGVSTGRVFTSFMAAQRYAAMVPGATIHPAS